MNKKGLLRTIITYVLIIALAMFFISILTMNVNKDMKKVKLYL